MTKLVFDSARSLAQRIRTGELSALQVLEAHLAQIERMNPRLNAIVSLRAEQALEEARQADASSAQRDAAGLLFGLPIAIKDLVETRGLRTTFGSPIFANHVPARDALIAERLRSAGAIVIGKTNVPEFGAGSQTFNPVFGETRNPWDPSRTCGGSSGGAAVALASGMLPIADGSDLGGSLRNPASFCSVVGFRPSPGRVPSWPSRTPWSPFAVLGPLGRSVADTAFLLAAIAGPDTRAPLSLDEPGERFLAPLERELRGTRVAWSRDLGGLPVDPAVTSVLDAHRAVFSELGCVVEDAEPDLEGAREAFQAWRAWQVYTGFGELLDRHRDQLKDTLVWNLEQGRDLSGPELGRAETARVALCERMQRFLERYEFLLLPAAQVPPFPLEQPWVREINGVELETYIDWMRVCSDITVTTLPAISVPSGFTPAGLPIGLQIVGRPRDDFGVLQLAHAFEQATGYTSRHPPGVLD